MSRNRLSGTWPLVLALLLCLALISPAKGAETRFSGQVSIWSDFAPDAQTKFGLGARYLPQLTWRQDLANDRKLDFELSANLYGKLDLSSHLAEADAHARLYRAWGRWAYSNGEFRLGLQKINFGSAQILRPLMWFDSLDPRDPLQMTSGVWAGLFRHYFANNANLWLWALFGNDQPKGWELFSGAGKATPEFGGRFQFPVPRGEAAFSYHYRRADLSLLDLAYSSSPEHRFGFDLRLDVTIGLWLEAALTHYTRDLGSLRNQLLLTVGGDYTFNLGNGLALTAEHLVYSQGAHPLSFDYLLNASALHFSYPLNLLDNLSLLVTYVWGVNEAMGTLTWERKYDNISLLLTAFWNPKLTDLPQSFTGSLPGKGLRLMFVWNY